MKRFFCFYFSSTWTANAQEGTLYGNLDIKAQSFHLMAHFLAMA